MLSFDIVLSFLILSLLVFESLSCNYFFKFQTFQQIFYSYLISLYSITIFLLKFTILPFISKNIMITCLFVFCGYVCNSITQVFPYMPLKALNSSFSITSSLQLLTVLLIFFTHHTFNQQLPSGKKQNLVPLVKVSLPVVLAQ